MPQKNLTNKFNLPDTIVAAASTDKHRVAGNISCTELLDSPRIRVLKKLHDYDVDVSDKLDAMLGTALHHVLEQSDQPNIRKRAFELTISTIKHEADKMLVGADKSKGEQLNKVSEYLKNLVPAFFPEVESKYILEKTMSVEIEPGFTLYGTFDLYDKLTGFIHDYKSCSVYKWVFPESRRQWKAQLNIYAWLLINEGYIVNGLRINPFFKDWSMSEKLRNKDYPEARIMEIPIELRSMEEIGNFISARIKLHRQAEIEGQLPLCTSSERWSKSDMWVCKESGGKRAINGSMKQTEKEAFMFIEENAHKFKKKLIIEHRPGQSLRCQNYCPVSAHCTQWQEEQRENKYIDFINQ